MPRKGGVPENLQPFEKGFDPRRNLKGAPPVLPDLKELIEKVFSRVNNGKPEIENIIDSLKKRAIKGDVRAIQEVLDRYYGKVTQKIDADINIPSLPTIIIKQHNNGD